MPYSAGYAIADIASLKALSSADLVNGYTRWVISRNTWYGWDSGSTLAGNNDTVVAINAAPATGRFIKILAREILTQGRTYYVRTDGNDSNNGLSNTAGGAFLTIQKAVDVAASLDLGIYNVTIKIADGTYTGGIFLKTLVGAGEVIIEGNLTTPSNVIITTSTTAAAPNAIAIFESIALGSTYTISGVQIQSSGSSWRGILVRSPGSVVAFKNVIIGSGLLRQICTFGGEIRCTGNYTITASAQCHFENSRAGKILAEFQPTTITLSNTPDFSIAFLLASQQSFTYIASFTGFVTFSGSATGKKYQLASLALFTGSQNNLNYLPGSLAGTTVENSLYL